MAQPLVSVAVPVYNQVDLVATTVDSIRTQQFENYEIVIADDGSDDGTQEKLREVAAEDPKRIRLILGDGNQGVTRNCNRLLSECNGEYIAWLAGDDLMYPNKLDVQIRYMLSHPECALSFHQLDILESPGAKVRGSFSGKFPHDGEIRAYLRIGCVNGASSTMIRRDAIPAHGFREQLRVASDHYFWIECLASGGRYHYIDQNLGAYRRHSSNLSGVTEAVGQAEIDAIVTAWLLLRQYPEYAKFTRYLLADRFSEYRHVSDYNEALRLSLRMRGRLTRMGALALAFATKGTIQK